MIAYDEIFARYDEYRRLLTDFRERVKANRLWYRQQQTEYQGEAGEKEAGVPSSHSGHIFNAIQYKHADMMDNYPFANILPREESDEDAAKILTEVLPFIFERCGFKKTFSTNLYDKLISGICGYGVFYNEKANGGRGEIEIKDIELLNFTWQPDAPKLSDSRFIFYDSFMPVQDFVALYGEDFPNIAVQAQYDEQPSVQSEEISRTVIITDCYFKEQQGDGKKVLHFVKFSGSEVLFDSRDNHPDGFYKHAEFPFVLDVLHPIPGEIAGFGMVDVGKDMQAYIDRLDYAINRNALLLSKNRHFIQQNSGVNEEEFRDLSCDLVHVQGTLDEYHARRIDVGTMPEFVISHRKDKINELKEILGNRDFSQGGASGGITSGTAITALQTAADKLVRDSVSSSYIAFEGIVRLVIELIREFYTEERVFRIIGEDGTAEYKSVSSALFGGKEGSVFDISITVEKNNPYQRGLHNQLMMELNAAGLLNPQNFEIASFVLKNLNFDGKEKLLRDLGEAYEQMMHKQTPQVPTDGAGGGGQGATGGEGAGEMVPEGALEALSSGQGPLVEIPIDSGMPLESAGGADPLIEMPLE